MAEIGKKTGLIITVVVVSSLILTGTGIGIWLGVRANIHPEPGWTLKITGNVQGGNTTITMSEIINSDHHRGEYDIQSGGGIDTYLFQGVILSILFQELININPDAENVSFIPQDYYSSQPISISEILNNNTYILAYMENNRYLNNYESGGNGYLWLIVPKANPSDYNGPRCVKNVVEIYFE
ncbi:MAG: hypothetical protein FK732_05910 [Asgard group archaeon]|nr:hypothetical protein [Asgard group archaeon]